MLPGMTQQTGTKAKAGAIIVPVTLFEQNCTILWHEPSKKAVVIDPGGDVPKIEAAIKETGVTVVDGHFKSEFDTVEAAEAAGRKLKSAYPMLQVEIYDAANGTRTLLSAEPAAS